MSKAKTAVKVRTLPEAYAILRRAIRQHVKESGLTERQVARIYLGLRPGPGPTLNDILLPPDLQDDDKDEKALRLWFYETIGRGEDRIIASHYTAVSKLIPGAGTKANQTKADNWRAIARDIWRRRTSSRDWDGNWPALFELIQQTVYAKTTIKVEVSTIEKTVLRKRYTGPKN